jgi:hypothetical protein
MACDAVDRVREGLVRVVMSRMMSAGGQNAGQQQQQQQQGPGARAQEEAWLNPGEEAWAHEDNMSALRCAVAQLGPGGGRVGVRLQTSDVARALTAPEVVEKVLEVLMANAAVHSDSDSDSAGNDHDR